MADPSRARTYGLGYTGRPADTDCPRCGRSRIVALLAVTVGDEAPSGVVEVPLCWPCAWKSRR